MATRATYQFKTGFTTSTVYIHWDGYLAGAADYFQEALNLRGDSKRDLFACFVWANDQATMTDGHEAHGDTDYRYNVERKNGEYHLEAYQRTDYSSNHFERVFIGTLEDFIYISLALEVA